MRVSDESSGKKKNTSEIVQELLALKSKISELPQKYPTGTFTFGTGVGEAQEQIPIICRNIDEAIRALDTGVDPYNHPITKSQIADGLIRLVNATRAPAFVGLMTAVLSSEGVQVLETYMNELERAASTIPQTVTEKYAPVKEKEKGMKFCPKCGSQIKEGSLFCENCGFALSKGEPKEKKPSKKVVPKMIVIIAIIAVVIIGVTYLVFSELWKTALTETPIQEPEGTIIQTTTPAPTTPVPTSLPVTYQDEEYLLWTTETLSDLTKTCELIKESIDAEDWEALERHCKDLYDFAKKALDEEKEFTASPELEPAKREFVKILNACRWAGYYGERGARNRDQKDLMKKTEYLETATACIERFTELLEEYNATK
ncbi:MAG: zinc-ribbon domain-containing protein [Methanomicrobia archaeon]|nr:zinc-ribbon domain-containing protein [Methanomicrobia archaeon]